MRSRVRFNPDPEIYYSSRGNSHTDLSPQMVQTVLGDSEYNYGKTTDRLPPNNSCIDPHHRLLYSLSIWVSVL